MMKEHSIKLRDGNVEINYSQKGEGTTTLLFLHGWCINSSYWEHQMTYFSNNYNAIALDLAGFGKSTAHRENWSIEEFASDISAFIKELDLKNIIILGHSMSGGIMLETALTKNPRIIGLVGVDNFKFIDVVFPPEQLESFQSFFQLLKDDFKHNAPIYAENMLFHPSTADDVKERIKSDFANANPEIGYSSFMNFMQYSQLTPNRLENLDHKLYLINNNTVPTNKAGLEKRCKHGFEIKNIGQTGHYPMIETPMEFNKLLEEIINTTTNKG